MRKLSPVIDAKERVLLNLFKFSGVSRGCVILVEWPKRRNDDMDRKLHEDSRMERTTSMSERLQSSLTRAEIQKALLHLWIAPRLCEVGGCLLDTRKHDPFFFLSQKHTEIKSLAITAVLPKKKESKV